MRILSVKCLTPSQYLNQCWLIVNSTLGNKLQWNFNKNSFMEVDLKMLTAILQPFCLIPCEHFPLCCISIGIMHDDVIKWKKNSALLALCVGNSLVTSEFPSQRPVTRSFDVFYDLHLNKWLSKQLWRRWFEMPSRSLWCHCNMYCYG